MRGPPRPLRSLALVLGAAGLAYHEIIRGWRVSVCNNCGRLNHRNSDLCPCGGTTEAPDESHMDPETVRFTKRKTTDWARYVNISGELNVALGIIVAGLMGVRVALILLVLAFIGTVVLSVARPVVSGG